MRGVTAKRLRRAAAKVRLDRTDVKTTYRQLKKLWKAGKIKA